MQITAEPQGPLPPFAARVERAGDEIRVVVSGELDMATVDQLDAALTEAESAAPDRLVLDLTDLAFMGSVGLRLLISTRARAESAQRQLVVLPSPAVQSLLEVTGTSGAFGLGRPPGHTA